MPGLLDRIYPTLGSPFTEQSDARVAHNKILVNVFYVAGPPIFERMIEHPSNEVTSAGLQSWLSSRVITTECPSQLHRCGEHGPGTPPLVHFAVQGFRNAVFAMAVAHFRSVADVKVCSRQESIPGSL